MSQDLYALAPEDFTAARDAAVRQARADGDRPRAREIAALRRPTLPAHLVNLLLRAEPDLVTQLLALGEALAQAQRAGSADGVRGLGEQRRALVAAVTERAIALGAREVTATVRAEVAGTLEAALADPDAGAAVRSGRLVRALSYAGFGGADVSGAVAPDAGAAPVSRGPDPGAVRRAERAAQEAAGRLDDAVQACEAAGRREDAAVDRLSTATDAESEAEQALAAARAAREEAAATVSRAQQDAARSAEDVEAAQEAAAAARAALDTLRRTTD